ncbi:MAG: MaoC/PaaZ C-terminal domain-containing protein [Haliangiales bacterium]
MSAFDFERVGRPGRALQFSYDWKDCVLYALGVGAKLPDELPFLYEQRGPRVLPTFGVLPSFPSLVAAMGDVGANFAQVVHGEHALTVHHPIPARATVTTVATVTDIFDKGKGALILITCETRGDDDRLLFENRWSIFQIGAGGFGGERGPSARSAPPPADRAPDFEHREVTTTEQAALYRLSGDHNPLHIDPAMARAAGFDVPILHGLCTYGFAGRAVLTHACGGDPARLRSLAGRFAGTVLPGDALTTRGWQAAPQRYIVQVTKDDGAEVFSHATAEVLPSR